MELKLRKFNKFIDKTFIEGGKKAKDPVLLVSVAAIFENPWKSLKILQHSLKILPKSTKIDPKSYNKNRSQITEITEIIP